MSETFDFFEMRAHFLSTTHVRMQLHARGHVRFMHGVGQCVGSGEGRSQYMYCVGAGGMWGGVHGSVTADTPGYKRRGIQNLDAMQQNYFQTKMSPSNMWRRGGVESQNVNAVIFRGLKFVFGAELLTLMCKLFNVLLNIKYNT